MQRHEFYTAWQALMNEAEDGICEAAMVPQTKSWHPVVNDDPLHHTVVHLVEYYTVETTTILYLLLIHTWNPRISGSDMIVTMFVVEEKLS